MMSFKTTLTFLVLGLCSAVIMLAGVQLNAAWSGRQVAQQNLDEVPRLHDLKTISDALAAERLQIYAMTVSSRNLRPNDLPDVMSAIAQTDRTIEMALVRQRPAVRDKAQDAYVPYKAARLAAIEAAQASALLRDVNAGRVWLQAAKSFDAVFRAAALNKSQNNPAVSRLIEEVGRLDIALADDALEVTGLLASRGYFSSETIAALAGHETAYRLALDHIEELTRQDLPSLENSASAMLSALDTVYGTLRAEIVDVGVNGGEYPETARPEAWLALTFEALANVQAFRKEVLDLILQIERSGLEQAKKDVLISAAVIGVTLFGSIAALLVVIFKVVRPIHKAVRAVSELADGNVDFSLAGFSRRNELGALTNAIHSLRDGERKARADRAARLATNEQLIAEVDKVVSAAALGEFGYAIRRPEGQIDGGTEALMQGVTQLCDIVSGFARDVDHAVGALKEGDLTYRPERSYEGLFGDVTAGVASSMVRVGDIVGDVQSTAGQIDHVVDGISESAAELSTRTLQQTALVEESRAIMAELSNSVTRNSNAAREAAAAGQTVVEQATAGVQMIDKTAATMAMVEKGSKDISDIVNLIEEIAFQTNILALNASVEAARAGSAGSGFAIVAQEVRALARRVSDAAMTIGGLISTSVDQVQDAAGSVRETHASLRHIKDEISGVVDAVETIATLCEDQSTGAATIVGRFEEFKTTAETNQRMADSNQVTAEALAKSTHQMLSKVAFFRTGRTQRGSDAHADNAA